MTRRKDAEERAARRAELQLKDAKLKQSIDECTKARLLLPHLGYDDPVRACEQCVASRALILASASAASAPGQRPPGCGGGADAPSTAVSRGANVRHGEWF